MADHGDRGRFGNRRCGRSRIRSVRVDTAGVYDGFELALRARYRERSGNDGSNPPGRTMYGRHRTDPDPQAPRSSSGGIIRKEKLVHPSDEAAGIVERAAFGERGLLEQER